MILGACAGGATETGSWTRADSSFGQLLGVSIALTTGLPTVIHFQFEGSHDDFDSAANTDVRVIAVAPSTDVTEIVRHPLLGGIVNNRRPAAHGTCCFVPDETGTWAIRIEWASNDASPSTATRRGLQVFQYGIA
jgi:hypothetical protein